MSLTDDKRREALRQTGLGPEPDEALDRFCAGHLPPRADPRMS